MLQYSRKNSFHAFHLCCANKVHFQFQVTVKLHRVFLSWCSHIFTDRLFHQSLSETVSKSLRLSCGSDLPGRDFATLGPLVTAAVHPGFKSSASPKLILFFNLLALGRRQPPYIVLRLGRPVFLINSCLDLVSNLLIEGTPSAQVTELFCRVP